MSYFSYKDSFETARSLELYDYIRGGGYAGYNPNLQADTEATLSPLGLGILQTPSNTGEALQLRSTDIADIGMLIICEILDQNGYAVNTYSILNGTTPVPLLRTDDDQPAVVMRVNKVYNFSDNDVLTQGDVLVEQAGGGTIFSGFKAVDQYSFNLLFTIPVDKTGILLESESTMNRSAGTSSAVDIRTKIRVRGKLWWTRGFWGMQQNGNSAPSFPTADKPRLSPLTDIMVTATSSVNGVSVTGRVPVQLQDRNIGNF